MARRHWRLRVDGAARGNPGPAGIGIIVEDAVSGRKIKRLSEYIGEATNNVAEYSALLYGLRQLEVDRADELTIVTDSELLARQLQGRYRVKNPTLQALYLQVSELLRRYARVQVTHVAREDNTAADELANEGIDAFLAGKKRPVKVVDLPEQTSLF